MSKVIQWKQKSKFSGSADADYVAAERYCLKRARNLIRSIEIIHVESPKTPVKAYSVVEVA